MNDDHRCTRTYRLDRQTIERVDRLAGNLNLWQSALIEAMLNLVMDDIEAGRVKLRRRPVKYELEACVRE